MSHPLEPAQPAMYALAEDGGLDLLFLACGHCSALSFPSNIYGCHRCGAPALAGEIVRRPGKGRLRNAVTVHQSLVPGLAAPYVIGELELAAGVVEEAVLDVPDETGLVAGMWLQAVARPAGDDRFLCRFIPSEPA